MAVACHEFCMLNDVRECRSEVEVGFSVPSDVVWYSHGSA